MTRLSGEALTPPYIPNTVELAVTEQFGDPALWNADPDFVRLKAGRMAGLSPKAYYDNRYDEVTDPRRNWVTLLYGSRVVGNSTRRPTIETASLQTMVDIHAHVAQTILAGEHTRPSVLVEPPNAREHAIARDYENNMFWLAKIASGVWPIMATEYKYQSGAPIYYNHDYSDTHNAVMALLPRESQDLITQTAGHQLWWSKQLHDGAVSSPVLSLNDDPPSNHYGDITPAGFINKNGIEIIDRFTDSEQYIDLLQYLMYGNEATPEERLSAIKAYTQSGRKDWDSPLHMPAFGLTFVRCYTTTMANFISRHGNQTNATPEAIADAWQGFETGAIRIAKKLLGESVSSTDANLSPSVDKGNTTLSSRERLAPPLGRVISATRNT